MKQSRRTFLSFLGKGTIVGATAFAFPTLLSGCKEGGGTVLEEPAAEYAARVTFQGVKAKGEDVLQLAEGFQYDVIASLGDKINDKDTFGDTNDYLAFLPLNDAGDDGLLWVNHEYPQSLMLGSRADEDGNKTKEQIDIERYNLGGSIVRIQKDANEKWNVVQNDAYNRRLNGTTMIPFEWDEPIMGSAEAEGTFANCSGGITPWGTILTCEENTDSMYGDNILNGDGERVFAPSWNGWEQHYDNPPEHYGWVVEVDVKTGNAKKLVALGRFAHECATMYETPDGRVVVYTGDDGNDRCLYKFVSSEKGSLKNGTLYVANVEKGEWISLNYDEQPILQEKFSDQTEVLVRCREAAIYVGGSELARPEDIEIDPISGDVFIALTNNKPKGDLHGSILKLTENSEDKTGLSFTSETFIAGGESTGFSSPDNMAFDTRGNFWFTTDVSGSSLGEGDYDFIPNNGLYLVPRSGERAGEIICVATAPIAAEFTGPFFHPDGKTLFLSVQHPGETSTDLDDLTSNWPNRGEDIPRSSVVAISGKSLEDLLGDTPLS